MGTCKLNQITHFPYFTSTLNLSLKRPVSFIKDLPQSQLRRLSSFRRVLWNLIFSFFSVSTIYHIYSTSDMLFLSLPSNFGVLDWPLCCFFHCQTNLVASTNLYRWKVQMYQQPSQDSMSLITYLLLDSSQAASELL